MLLCCVCKSIFPTNIQQKESEQESEREQIRGGKSRTEHFPNNKIKTALFNFGDVLPYIIFFYYQNVLLVICCGIWCSTGVKCCCCFY